SPEGLPPYDRGLLMMEMELFRHWLCGRHLGLALSEGEEHMLDETFELLVANALEQPRVFVHRDYHSRNLMITHPPTPGILDFQDAVAGPVTYDLVSLLKDAYIHWPLRQVDEWAWGFFQLAVQSAVLRDSDEARFQRWFDLMGVQRHVKVAGIFARLYRRDAKVEYLKDIPLVLDYIRDMVPRYAELEGLGRLISERVAPALKVAA
ncbi:MAG: phosphotransferase, partial [Pseudomonadota bacterium]